MKYRFVVVAATAIFWLFTLLMFTLGGCGTETSRPDRAADESGQLDLGRRVYASECAICHGDSGEGGTGPALGDRLVEKYPDPEIQELLVSRGRNSMAGFATRLTIEDIEAVVLYTRTALPGAAPS